MQKFTIPGRLDGLNEYISKERSNRYAAGNLKKKNQKIIMAAIMAHGVQPITKPPIILKIEWHDNGRRDIDNVCFAKKFILDALQEAFIIEDDNRKNVVGFTDLFSLDKNEHIDVTILEEGEY